MFSTENHHLYFVIFLRQGQRDEYDLFSQQLTRSLFVEFLPRPHLQDRVFIFLLSVNSEAFSISLSVTVGCAEASTCLMAKQ